jgi:hypothetical protein
MAMMGQVFLTLRFYFYGDQGPSAVAHAEPLWQSWINEHFPTAGDESAAA